MLDQGILKDHQAPRIVSSLIQPLSEEEKMEYSSLECLDIRIDLAE